MNPINITAITKMARDIPLTTYHLSCNLCEYTSQGSRLNTIKLGGDFHREQEHPETIPKGILA